MNFYIPYFVGAFIMGYTSFSLIAYFKSITTKLI